MTSATVTKLDVQAGHPEHDRLIDNVNKVRDRVTDLFDGHGPNEAIDIAQAMEGSREHVCDECRGHTVN